MDDARAEAVHQGPGGRQPGRGRCGGGESAVRLYCGDYIGGCGGSDCRHSGIDGEVQEGAGGVACEGRAMIVESLSRGAIIYIRQLR